MDKVAEILAGPVGGLIGAGLQAAFTGISQRNRATQAFQPLNNVASPRTPVSPRAPNFYDNVENHLHGAMRVLKPALELKDMFAQQQGRRSTDAPLLAKPQKAHSTYQTPQASRCSGCKCSGQKSKSDRVSSKRASNDSSSSRYKSRQEESPDVSGYPIHSSTRLDSKNRTKLFKKKENSKENNPMRSCVKCKISIDSAKMLMVIPCGHVFCSLCIAEANFVNCPVCRKRVDTSNVTRISEKSF